MVDKPKLISLDIIKAYKAGKRDAVEYFKEQKCKNGLRHYCPNCDNTIIGCNEYELKAILEIWFRDSPGLLEKLERIDAKK